MTSRRTALQEFKKQGLDIRLGAKVAKASAGKKGVSVEYDDAEGDQSADVRQADRRGRASAVHGGICSPMTPASSWTSAALSLSTRTAGHGCRACYAVGDCVRGPMLAHKGSEEGVMVADLIAGETAEMNYDVIPSVIYTAPEIAWTGKTEAEVKASGQAYKTGSFPFMASGRAKAMEQTAGMVKIISSKDDDEILGVHIVGPMAGELISEAVLALEFSASTEDLQRTIHAHPSLAEAMHEAALAVDNRALNFPNR